MPPHHYLSLLLMCLWLSNRAQSAGGRSKTFSTLYAHLPLGAETLGFRDSFLNLAHSERGRQEKKAHVIRSFISSSHWQPLAHPTSFRGHPCMRFIVWFMLQIELWGCCSGKQKHTPTCSLPQSTLVPHDLLRWGYEAWPTSVGIQRMQRKEGWNFTHGLKFKLTTWDVRSYNIKEVS